MTDSGARARGKVAAILSKRELVLSVEAEGNVTVGTRFVVLQPNFEVKDPDTGEVLGSVTVPKTVVKVVRVDGPRLCVARTFRTIKGKSGIANLNILPSSIYGTPDRVETLSVDEDAIARDNQMRVNVGDPVLETSGDEYDDLA